MVLRDSTLESLTPSVNTPLGLSFLAELWGMDYGYSKIIV
jgi:hypothetical protein